jgi:hypothetical protein
MKQDKLEQFVIENRDEFDVYEPGDELWDRIQKPSPKVIKLNWKTIAIRVAAVVVIFIASYFFHDMMQSEKSSHIAQQKIEMDDQQVELVQVLMEAEIYYSSQINSAKDEIFRLSGNNQELIDDINFDMVELDEVFQELKDDLKDNSDNEEVIEAMIQNYRIKLQVLEEILNQLEKTKNPDENENNNHEI